MEPIHVPGKPAKGIVYLAGAGPGDPSLVTLRTKELLEQADVILYDHLCHPRLLRWARPGAQMIYVGKTPGKPALTQRMITEQLIAQARAGKKVLRLKGGDPFLFGRGAEEASALADAGVAFEVVPGVSSALAVPAYAGIPLTHRELSSCALILTGHEDPQKKETQIRWDLVATLPGTKVILMGATTLHSTVRLLLEKGMNPKTPSAAIQWGTYPWQKTIQTSLEELPARAQESGLGPPMIVILGEVVNLRTQLQWWEKRPLWGQRVVLTRPMHELELASRLLQELGADVLEIPTIQIEPLPLEPAQLQWIQRCKDSFDWLVFTSANGAKIFFELLWKLHGDVRALGNARIAAVGKKTAQAVEAFHLKVDLIPERFTTEELAQKLTDEDVKNKRVCLVRGTLADPKLKVFLEAHGAQVIPLTVYQTTLQREDPTGDRNRLQNEGAHWILFASPSAVHAWKDLGLDQATKNHPRPKYASIGPVTTQALKHLGYPVDCEASEHTMKGLIDCLLQEVNQSHAPS